MTISNLGYYLWKKPQQQQKQSSSQIALYKKELGKTPSKSHWPLVSAGAIISSAIPMKQAVFTKPYCLGRQTWLIWPSKSAGRTVPPLGCTTGQPTTQRCTVIKNPSLWSPPMSFSCVTKAQLSPSLHSGLHTNQDELKCSSSNASPFIFLICFRNLLQGALTSAGRTANRHA